jgi:nucleotide-binding universal stress UspA family protein
LLHDVKQLEGGVMKPILLATDGSPSAEAATLEAIELARAFDASLLIASVAQLTAPAYGGYYGYAEVAVGLHKAEIGRVAEVLATAKARVDAAGVRCETIALDGIASDEICRLALEGEARLVVVGAHGWGWLGRIIHGSVSTRVLHEAPCPVLVVHGADQPAAVLVELEHAPVH